MAESNDTDELLSVTRYAEVSAYLLYFGFGHQQEVRRRLEVDEGTWHRSEAHWVSSLAADAVEGDAEDAPAFARAFGDTERRLKNEAPAIEDIGTLAPPTAAEEQAPQAERPEPLPPAKPEPTSPPPVAPAPAASPIPAGPLLRTPTPSSATASPWAASSKPLGADDAPTRGTAAIDPNALAAVLASTPFSGESKPAPAPAAAALDDASVDKGATGFVDPAAIARAVTPFAGEEPAAPAEAPVVPPAPVAPSPVAPPAPAEAPVPPGNPDATAFVDASALGTADLPFGDAPALPPPSALTAEDQASFGETSAIDPAQFAHLVIPFSEADAAPPPAPEPASLGTLDDLQQYASYCVELVAYPGHEATIRHRYGVSSKEQHDQTTAAWNTRLADPTTRQRYQHAIETYRAWLARQQGR